MKKVLWAGHYRDSTGYGEASIGYMLALDAVGVDVVCRPIRLNDSKAAIPKRILELEAKSSAGANVFVAHTLPQYFQYDGRFDHCFGLYASETSDFRQATWADRINAMDAAIVINHQMVGAARRSGVTVPLHVVPHAVNMERFQQSVEPLESIKHLRKEGLTFYWAGEFNRRKNLAALLKAFHTEFTEADDVNLVIKTSKPGMTPDDCRVMVENYCTELKRGMKLHGKPERYKKETIITERLTEKGLLGLHSACDVFVMPSYGEASCLFALDAMAMGRTPIVSKCTGFLEYVSDNEGWLVDGREEPVFGETETFADLYSGYETWFSVDIRHLQSCMRQAYEQGSVRLEKSRNCVTKAYDFSLESIGQKLKGVLFHGEQARVVAASS